MLDFVVTNHWWQKYESGEKNTEYRRKTPYWDKRVENVLIQNFGLDFGTYLFYQLQMNPVISKMDLCRFTGEFAIPATIRHGYTSEKRSRKIISIFVKNGKDIDLAIDDWVYCFCFEKEK